MQNIFTHTLPTKTGQKTVRLDREHRLGTVLTYYKNHVVNGMAFYYNGREHPFDDTSWKIFVAGSPLLCLDNVRLKPAKYGHHLKIGPEANYRGNGAMLSGTQYQNIINAFCENFKHGPAYHEPAHQVVRHPARIYDKLEYLHGRHVVLVVSCLDRLVEVIDFDKFGRPECCLAYPLLKKPPFKSTDEAIDAGNQSVQSHPKLVASFRLSSNPDNHHVLFNGTHVDGVPQHYFDALTLRNAADDCFQRFNLYIPVRKALRVSKKMDEYKSDYLFNNAEEKYCEQQVLHNKAKIAHLKHDIKQRSFQRRNLGRPDK